MSHDDDLKGETWLSDAQLAKYLRQARGSADELQDELETLDRRKLTATEYNDLLPRARVLCKKLSRFIDTVDPRNRRDQRDRRR